MIIRTSSEQTYFKTYCDGTEGEKEKSYFELKKYFFLIDGEAVSGSAKEALLDPF